MEKQIKENKIVLLDENKEMGLIEFHEALPGVIDACHTFVYDDYRGQGVARKLFNELVIYVREEKLRVIPSCSYIKKIMDETDEYDDIYHK